jgi:hypothetical protein
MASRHRRVSPFEAFVGGAFLQERLVLRQHLAVLRPLVLVQVAVVAHRGVALGC